MPACCTVALLACFRSLGAPRGARRGGGGGQGRGTIEARAAAYMEGVGSTAIARAALSCLLKTGNCTGAHTCNTHIAHTHAHTPTQSAAHEHARPSAWGPDRREGGAYAT